MDPSPQPEAPAAAMGRRQALVDVVLATAEVFGFEPDPREAGRWWLPGTDWCLRCTPLRCTVYLANDRRPGGYRLKSVLTFEIGKITEVLHKARASRPTEAMPCPVP